MNSCGRLIDEAVGVLSDLELTTLFMELTIYRSTDQLHEASPLLRLNAQILKDSQATEPGEAVCQRTESSVLFELSRRFCNLMDDEAQATEEGLKSLDMADVCIRLREPEEFLRDYVVELAEHEPLIIGSFNSLQEAEAFISGKGYRCIEKP